jgi:triosephosphate isomerase
MRQKIIAGNWKMNKNLPETKQLIDDLNQNLPQTNARIIIAPSFICLDAAKKLTEKTKIEVASQNIHQAEGGAFTGEVSAHIVKSTGINITIIGHSERRQYFKESDALLANKVDTALKHEMEIIFCFGEELEDRQKKNHFNLVHNQLTDGLFHLPAGAWSKIILAYEPVWAIGTGETATPEQAEEMHAFIRETIANKYNQSMANEVKILYGGSVKPSNAKEIFSKSNVDGGLIGGASLLASDFIEIIKGAE